MHHRAGRRPALRIALSAGLALIMILGAASSAAAQTPFSALFERETLTGDWGGLRTTLAEKGVEVGLSNYGDLLSVVTGGLARRTTYSDLIEPTAAIDLDKLLGWKGGRLFFRGIGTYGGDPRESTGSISNPSNIAGDIDTFKLFEGWFEQGFFEEILSIRVGLYAADTEFDVRETAAVFLNSGFGTGLDLSESGLNGPCIYPTSCLGARIRVQPTPAYYLQAAVLDGVAGDPNDPRGTQVKLGDDDGVLVLSEIGYQRRGPEVRFLRAALGGWVYTTTLDDVKDVDAAGDPRRRHGTYGVYALLEGELYREPARTQGLSGFLRAGFADQHVNQLRYFVSGGLAYTGLIPGREDDVTGFGVLAGLNGSKFKEAQELAGTTVAGEEVVLEWNYRARLFPWMSIELDAQYIINPGTSRTTSDAFVVGFRHTVKF